MNDKNLFSYWVGDDYRLIKYLRDLMVAHSNQGENYNVVYITEKNIREYVYDIPKRFYELIPAHQADFLRVYLITKYGGIWADADTLIMNDLSSLFAVFEVKSGFFITEEPSLSKRQYEKHLSPCNGVYGSRPNTDLMSKWLDYVYFMLNSEIDFSWSQLGHIFLYDTLKNEKYLFDDYHFYDGKETMYPVHWELAEKVYCSSEYNYLEVKRNFQPLIIFVNAVYRAVEANPHLLDGTLLSELLEISNDGLGSGG